MSKKIIKIAMIGSLGSGKSSLVASIWHCLFDNLSEIFTISDRTQLDNSKLSGQNMTGNSLNDLRLGLIGMTEKTSKCPFLTKGTLRSYSIGQYDLDFRIFGTNSKFKVQLTDIPGSFLNNSGHHDETILKTLRESDTIIVAVDTPFLMHKEEIVRRIGNNIPEIFNVLSKLSCSANAKTQIIFVPLKCEYWIHCGLMDKVFDATLSEYASVISMLKHHSGVEISIIPVETVGGIEFCEFRDAFVLINKKHLTYKQCSPLCSDNSIAALSNGRIVKVKDDEVLCEDPNAFFPNFGIKKPLQWFQPSGNVKAKYHPHYCEQIILYSIKFVFSSILEKPINSLIRYLYPPLLIGNLSSSDMKQVLRMVEPFIKPNYLNESAEKTYNQK